VSTATHRPRLAPPPLEDGSLPRQLTGLASPIVWGVLLLITIEGTVLVLLVVSYFYLRLGAEAWPPPGVPLPDLLEPTIGQALLLASLLPAWLGLRAIARGRVGVLLAAIPAGVLLAGGYLVQKVLEYADADYLWTAHAYGSLDWTMSAYAMLHVVVVILAAVMVWALAWHGHFGAHRYTGVQALLIYWAFAAVGSVLFYATQYLSPYL
jgi:heme/copper-type cytochrome/quinol oxidase subunit 3